MIELKGIYKWVNTGNNRNFLLRDINLSIKEGEFVSIMGPSGSGKTTLLNVIGMLDEFKDMGYQFINVGADVVGMNTYCRSLMSQFNGTGSEQ